MPKYKPYTREQMKNIIEGKQGYDRIPTVYHFWVSPGTFGDDAPIAEQYLEEYPCDITTFFAQVPDPVNAPPDDPNYKWLNRSVSVDESEGFDARVLLEDWDDLDDVLEHFPDPDYKGVFSNPPPEDGRYCMMGWWFCLFERHWSLRGMENALTDFYLYPDEVHRLYQKLTDFYMRIIERAHEEFHVDAAFTSDDIGTQKGPFFSEEIFKEFFLPYYKQIVDKAHSLGMHFWLHTCGNVEKFIPYFVDIGLDVLHPIQKYTMDQRHIAERFGGKITFWAGFDVQQVIPYGTPEDVRNEVRYMIDTYARPEGRFMLTFGNGVTPDCKIESFCALLEESYTYGKQKMAELHAE